MSSDFVVRELRKRNAPFWRFNVEDAPLVAVSNDPTSKHWNVRCPNRQQIRLDQSLTGIWNRRPGRVGEGILKASVGDYVNDQWHQLIRGLTCLNEVCWVNDPYANQRAECKPLQLSLAEEIGLRIPDTCITNDADSLDEFRTRHPKGVVVKALYAPFIEDENSFVFTHLLEITESPIKEEIRLSPLICQQALLPKKDLRVTIVGQQIYTAQMESGPDDPVDWRQASKEAPWHRVELPGTVATQLLRLNEALGLKFAGIDLVWHAGEYYFIELNPNGEWGWLQAGARLPIAEALADLLTRPKV